MKWRFLDTGVQDGPQNMGVDEALLKAVAEGKSPPTLRFYEWRPPCLSLGYFQSIETVSMETCRNRGITVVRRLTGGRSILHNREVTYSIILPEDNPLLPAGVIASYEKLSRGLKAGLEMLGLKPELTGARTRKKGFSAACFDAPSWYELRIGKQKITGSAQTRKQDVLLQHGSVPLELESSLLYSLLNFSSEERRGRALRRFDRRATAINPALRHRGKTEVDRREVKKALLFGWRNTLNLDGEWGEMTPPEKQEAERLAVERYGSESWTGRR